MTFSVNVLCYHANYSVVRVKRSHMVYFCFKKLSIIISLDFIHTLRVATSSKSSHAMSGWIRERAVSQGSKDGGALFGRGKGGCVGRRGV